MAARGPLNFAKCLHILTSIYLRVALHVACWLVGLMTCWSKVPCSNRQLIDAYMPLRRYGWTGLSHTQTRCITTASSEPTRTRMRHLISMQPAEDAASFDVIVLGAGQSPL